MKTMRKFLVVALAALAFTACSKDDILLDEGGGNGNGKEIEGNAWIALNLRTTTSGFRGVNSRALNPDDDKLNGTADESNISQANIYLFNANEELVANIDLTGNGVAGSPGQPEGLSGTAFKIPKTSLYMLVVANPPVGFDASFKVEDADAIPSPIVGTKFDVVNKALDATVDGVTKKGGVGAQNYFMMTNAKGGLEPSDAAGNLISLTLHSTSADAEAAPMEIFIDRVVAKVRVIKSLSNNPSNGDPVVGDVNWRIDVTNKKYFPVSKRVKTHREIVPGYLDWVWSDRYKIGSYREDPNFDSATPDSKWITSPVTPPANQTNYNAHYNYYHAGNVPSTWNASLITVSEYCLENTQQASDNVYAYTTQVIIQAQFAPSKFTQWTLAGDVWTSSDVNNNAPGDASINWIKLSSGNYTFATLKTWLQKELWSKYKSSNPDNYQPLMTESFNDYLDGIGKAGDKLTILTAAQFTALGADFDTRYAAFMADFDTEYADAEAVIIAGNSAAHGSLTFYKGGVNYYQIMIRHDDSTANLNALGEFGVVRNAIYDIYVTKIMKSGYPIIPDPDPDTKDEDDDQYIAIKINVNPWTWYKQEVPL